jgi:hypothetical protein
MYAMFTRLCRSEGPPGREQLARGWAWHSVAALVVWLPAQLTDRGRRACRRGLVASQVAIALVLLAVLARLSWRSPATCDQAGRQRSVAHTRLWWPAQAAANGLIGK